MKDLARAEEALRNAHAAGDVESAKKIAMFIRDNQASQESGFSQNMQERGAKFANIAQGAEGYGKTVPEKLYQGTMNVVGTGADVIGEGASKLYQGFKGIIPEKGRQRLESDEARLQEMLAPLTPYAEKYQQNVQAYQKQEPRTAANLEATRELLNIVPLGFSPARSALKESGVAVKNITRSAVERKPIILTTDELKSISQKSYKKAADLGAVLRPEFSKKVSLSANELIPESEWGRIGARGGDTLSNVIEDIQKLSTKGMNLEDAQAFDMRLGDLISEQVNPKGDITPSGKKLYELQSNFRSMVENPSSDDIIGGVEGLAEWGRAKKSWAAMRRMDDIERILDKADTYDNPATYIKRQFANLESSKRINAYSKKERDFISKVARDGKFAGFLRSTAGSRLLGTIFGGAATGGLGGAVAGALASDVAREASEAIIKNKVGKLAREVGESAIDQATAKGKLYKYFGKEKGDALFAQVRAGKVPSGVGTLPPKEAKIILDEVKRIKAGQQ